MKTKSKNLSTAQAQFRFINTRKYMTTHDIAIFTGKCDNTARKTKKDAEKLSGHALTSRTFAVPTKYVLAVLDLTLDELKKSALAEQQVSGK